MIVARWLIFFPDMLVRAWSPVGPRGNARPHDRVAMDDVGRHENESATLQDGP